MENYLPLMDNNSKERLIRTIVVSNEKKVDVFRIHVFEKSIKFDPHFAYGVSKNDSIYEMVMDIERLWVERKIELPDIFNMMIGVIEKHERYLEQFYFKSEELDFAGRISKILTYSSQNDKNYMYFMCMKKQNNLKRITREEFEKNMKNEEVAKSYVDNYSMKNATFYSYNMAGLKESGRDCYLMIIGDDLKVGFVKS